MWTSLPTNTENSQKDLEKEVQSLRIMICIFPKSWKRDDFLIYVIKIIDASRTAWEIIFLEDSFWTANNLLIFYKNLRKLCWNVQILLHWKCMSENYQEVKFRWNSVERPTLAIFGLFSNFKNAFFAESFWKQRENSTNCNILCWLRIWKEIRMGLTEKFPKKCNSRTIKKTRKVVFLAQSLAIFFEK